MKKRTKSIIAIVIPVAVVLIAAAIIIVLVFGRPQQQELNNSHVFNVETSREKLIENGQSRYSILIPSDADTFTSYAAEELQFFTEEATGFTLPIVRDSGVVENGSYISIGDTVLYNNSDLDLDKSILKDNGYYIRSKDNDVFIVGGDGRGNTNGVYTFLKYQFGYEYFADGAYSLERNVFDKNLMRFDVKDVPDIKYRSAGFGEINYNVENTRRLRLYRGSEIFIPIEGQTIHNVFYVVDEEARAAHPNWVGTCQNQLCYTRDADGLSDYVVEKLKTAIEENPDLNTVTFTQQDVNDWCACAECKKVIEKYKVNSATQILFINEVARKIKPWLEETYPERDIKICIFAYFITLEAPVNYDAENDTYTPIDSEIILDDMVAIYYAPYQARNYYPLNAEQNSVYGTAMKKWASISDSLYLWLYGCHFSNYFIPLDNISSLQETIRYCVECNADYFYIQSQWNTVCSDWSRLKMYLQANLMWDCNQDVQSLIDRFFEGYFGPAADAMEEYYRQFIGYSKYLADELGLDNAANLTPIYTSADTWKYSVLMDWKACIDEAYENIELLLYSDPGSYQAYYDRINLEELTPNMLLYLYHQGTFSTTAYREFSDQLFSDCKRLGISRYSEGGNIDSIFER